MTPAQACKVLGVSHSSSRSQIEQAYKSKRQKLQLQLVAGQSLSKREQAGQQMAKLVTAREVLGNTPAKASRGPKSAHRKTRRRAKQDFNNPFWPQPHGRPLADFVGAIPLPRTVVILSLILSLLIVISMIRSCANTCVNVFKTMDAKLSSQINTDTAANSSVHRPVISTENVQQLNKKTKRGQRLEI